MSPETYQASGGTSELRPYGDGEQCAIELHRESFSVLWSAAIPAGDFMRQVAHLVAAPDIGSANLSPSDDDEGEYAFPDALAKIETESVSADFIHVDVGDGEAITWRAPDLDAAHDQWPYAPGQVGVICREFRAAWLGDFIRRTATPHVAGDITDILGSAERLTSNFSSVAE